MTSTFATLRRLLFASTIGVTLAGCGGSDTGTGPTFLAGSYTATTLRVTPAGQQTIDVIAQGGALTVTIASDNTTSGTLSIPAGVAGPGSYSLSMAGTAVQSGNTVHFQQNADTFVRDLAWSVSGNTLQASNQSAGSASYTITLTRQ